VASETTMTFEQALARLDEVVGRLESGSVGLEEAVGLFEQGREYLAVCRARLDASRARVEELMAEDAPPTPDETAGPL